MSYAERVLDYYNNPRNAGTLDKLSQHVGTGLVHVSEYVDVVRFQIEVNPATHVIREARFKTFGCGSAIACSSIVTEWIKGKTIEEAFKMDHMDVVEALSLPPSKIHSAILTEDAVRAAINDYRSKNGMEAAVEEGEEEPADYYDERD
jgi:nitrogen fixation NifU-like protein